MVAMPRYYFVLSSKEASMDDPEGTELPDLVAARQEADKDVEHLRQPRVGGRRCWVGWAMQMRDEGGAVETVQPGRTGARVPTDDPDDWAAAIRDVAGRVWDPEELRREASRFSAERFDREVLDWVGIGG